MAKDEPKNRLQELVGVHKDLLARWMAPGENHGVKLSQVEDARQAVDDHRDELIRAGVVDPKSMEKHTHHTHKQEK